MNNLIVPMTANSSRKPSGAAANKHGVPDWARPGRVRYARWDGGEIEVAKAALSGWYWAHDSQATEASRTWYSDYSLELLLQAKVNWIWATYSVGFSGITELPQQQELQQFMLRCHEHGIRVTAYLSMTNLFIDDMRRNEQGVDEWLQRDSEGQVVPYRAAVYQAKPSRLLACMNHPSWRDYVSKRVERAVGQGFDGIFFDNLWTECRCRHCQDRWGEHCSELHGQILPWPEQVEANEMVTSGDCGEKLRIGCTYDLFCNSVYQSMFQLAKEAAHSINADCLIYGNFNSPYQTFTYPTNNAVSTEEGVEPGVVEGKLVHNAGLLLTLAGAGAGWRPVRLEYGRGRGSGQLARKIDEAGVGATRFVAMEPRKHQLSIAEAAAYGVSFEIAPEGEFQRDLHLRTSEAMANWDAIARYQDFICKHSELYCDTVPASRIVSLHSSGFRRPHDDDYSQRPNLIGALARNSVMLDVRYDQDLSDLSQSQYDVMLLADVWSMSQKMVDAVKSFHQAGGKLVCTGDSGLFDEHFKRRREGWLRSLPGVLWLPEPATREAAAEPSEQSRGISLHGMPVRLARLDRRKVSALAQKLNSLSPPIAELVSPPSVLWRATWDRQNRLLIHLLNYHDKPALRIHLRLPNHLVKESEWFSPDPADPNCATREGSQAVNIRKLDIYGVLRLTVEAVETK